VLIIIKILGLIVGFIVDKVFVVSEELGMTVRKKDFGEWYLEVVKKAGLLDQRYPVKGFPVYMPWAVFMIKRITSMLEQGLEQSGHEPAAFPVVIPESSLRKEREHVKSFEKEVFWITHAGQNKLDERLFLRPTSETAIYPMYSLWIRTYQDLPLKLYQSCQVYRYETKMTKPLIRGREFFWIESHTVQRTNEDAKKQIEEDMKITEDVIEKKLGIPFILCERPPWDKFPGAEGTYAYDTIMPDGKTAQVATTHNLGTRFSKPFDIKFVDENEKKQYAYQTCFGPGVSRILSAVISVHGDDKGLVLPPELAPVQVVIIPISVKGHEKDVIKKSNELCAELSKCLRVKLDNRNYRPGFKFNEWELKGVPVRLEIGPDDVAKKQVTLVRRDTGKRIVVSDGEAKKEIDEIMKDIFDNMKARAKKFFDENLREAKNYKELKEKLKQGGLVKISFCYEEDCAQKLKDDTGAEIRGPVFKSNEKPGEKCAHVDLLIRNSLSDTFLILNTLLS